MITRDDFPPKRSHPPVKRVPMQSTAERAGRVRVSDQPELLRLHLQIGSETVEVRILNDGLHFLDPESPGREGLLLWDEAIASALLPERARRAGVRPAA